jgi:hypothetical protein
MGYAYNSNTGASSAWVGGGTVDHSRAIKIGASTALADFNALPSYGVSTAGYTWGGSSGNIAWFCAGVYPTKVTPIVTPAASTIIRGNPATFTLKRSVADFTAPNKTAYYRITYRFNNSGSWLNIPSTVSTVFDKQLSLTISADLSGLAITPNLTFPASTIPLAANSVCVQMQFVGAAAQHVVYTGNPASACIGINAPPPPPPSWASTASSTATNVSTGASGTSITAFAGETIHFTHIVTNNSTSGTASPPINWYTNGSPAITPQSGINGALGVGGSFTVTSIDFKIPNGTVPGTLYCKSLTYSPTSSSNGGATTTAQACVTVSTPICAGSASTLPTLIQPGDTALVTFSYNMSLANQTVSWSIPSMPASGSFTAPAGSTSNSPPISIPVPGGGANNYAIVYTVTATTGQCGGTIHVVTLPTFAAFGASIRSGDCTNPGILGGWYNDSGHYGSSTQLAAIALVNTLGVASSIKTPSSSTISGSTATTLSFANTIPADITPGATPSPKLGGTFGDTTFCVTDAQPDPQSQPNAATSLTITNTTMDYTFPASIHLTGGAIGQVGSNGTKIGLFVTGNVFINSNIYYSGAGSWTSTTNIPSFILHATGNIYIGPNVTQLDGIYNAKGTIYTCAQDIGVFYPDIYSSCNKQLVVHGSFAAKNINLLRTFGTLKDSASGTGCVNQGAPQSFPGSCAAEVFDFSPELFVPVPEMKQPNGGNPVWDSVTSLPPIL